ncbi:MAG: 23S rRNA (guanosine(2251)-2'-O)-methyltransferase RlmB [Alphaproteobacteria bacterium]|nr:23S rRNA (guanosine(2251)-2'-O)-methyltransferase RlmB [Alphaproteobacteria bacterium]MCL2505182.1 23S rRNA (guanosine(2251)-2'-O)-methyltransferase RlmB [Alphaproteobacteria bacterium]
MKTNKPKNNANRQRKSKSDFDAPYAGKSRSDKPRSGKPRNERFGKSREDFSEKPRGKSFKKPREEFSDKPRGKFGKLRDEFSDKPRSKRFEKPREDFPEKPRGKSFKKPRGKFSDRPRSKFVRFHEELSDRPREERFKKPSFKKRPFKRDSFSSSKKSSKPFDKKHKRAFSPVLSEVSSFQSFIWGLHAAKAAFLNPVRKIQKLFLTPAGQKLFKETQSQAKEALLKRPDAKLVSNEEIEKLLPLDTVHQGIVLEASPLPAVALHDIISAASDTDFLIVLDHVTDPHNIGAVLRSASAFGAKALVVTERNSPAYSGVIAKSASGALDLVPLVAVVNLSRALEELKQAGFWCIGLSEEGSKHLHETPLKGKTALVLGAEGSGLRHLTKETCDELSKLPTVSDTGAVSCLNVSNAAAAALYEIRRQRL